MANLKTLIYQRVRSLSSTIVAQRSEQSRGGTYTRQKENKVIGASFSLILGIVGLGMCSRTATKLWAIPSVIAELQLALGLGLWVWLTYKYLTKIVHDRKSITREFEDPVFGCTGALIGISALVLVPGLVVYSPVAAVTVTVGGVMFHLYFSMRHTFNLWVAGNNINNVTPALYLPDVAGNFTSASALAAIGQHDWAWLFFGAGLFSWLSLEPIVKKNIIYGEGLPTARRHTAGIQAAPAAVCASSLLNISPTTTSILPSILLGYALYQMLHAIKLFPWLRKQPLSKVHWSYTFGLTSALNCTLKLTLMRNAATRLISAPLMILVSSFIVYLFMQTVLLKRSTAN